MYFYYSALGKALGGSQYIAHMGQAGAAGAILFIGAGCLATASELLLLPGYAKVFGTLMVGLSAIFLIAQWGLLPIAMGTATYVRPLGFQGEYALFLLPLASLLTLICAKPDSP